MKEVELLRIAIGALAAVITALVTAIIRLYKDIRKRDTTIIDFAENLLKRGDPGELLKEITKFLQRHERKEKES